VPRGDKKGAVSAGANGPTYNLPIQKNRPPLPYRHPLGIYIPTKVAFSYPNCGKIEENPKMGSDPGPSRMEDPVSVHEENVRPKPFLLGLPERRQIRRKLAVGKVSADVGETGGSAGQKEVKELALGIGQNEGGYGLVIAVSGIHGPDFLGLRERTKHGTLGHLPLLLLKAG
jgi:hypothetical protein